MQISVSPASTLTKMDQLAQCHDVRVKEWKQSIERMLKGIIIFNDNTCSTVIICHCTLQL